MGSSASSDSGDTVSTSYSDDLLSVVHPEDLGNATNVDEIEDISRREHRKLQEASSMPMIASITKKERKRKSKNGPSVVDLTIVVCGESRSGKSTLINAAYGKEVCEVYGGTRPCTEEPQEVYIPDRNIRLIDTRGFEFDADHHNTLRSYHPHVVWVVMPWGAQGTWDLVNKIFPGVPMILVLTKCDWLRRHNMWRCEDTKWFGDRNSEKPPVLSQHFWQSSVVPKREDFFRAQIDYPNIRHIVPISIIDEESSDLPSKLKPGLAHLYLSTLEILHYRYNENNKGEDEASPQNANHLANILIKNVNRSDPVGLSVATILMAASAASGAAWIPAPALDAVAVTAVQVGMVSHLCTIWEEEMFNAEDYIYFIRALFPVVPAFGIGYGIATALKFIPVYGTAVGGALSMSVALGMTLFLGVLVTLYLHHVSEKQCRDRNDTLIDTLAASLGGKWADLYDSYVNNTMEEYMESL